MRFDHLAVWGFQQHQRQEAAYVAAAGRTDPGADREQSAVRRALPGRRWLQRLLRQGNRERAAGCYEIINRQSLPKWESPCASRGFFFCRESGFGADWFGGQSPKCAE